MKKLYFACYVVAHGKTYPFVDCVTFEHDNIVNRFNNYDVAMPCETKKKAEAIVSAWIEDFKKQGKYAIIL